ncbi:DUF859 family phage minor structural protein [Enterococcus sp. AZ109]|uniref:DUF859 family phage minor structural protein n=1 Tax=Enterococcus sp. AZ109 TaxID=2774634 RepID=UPI003F21B3E2
MVLSGSSLVNVGTHCDLYFEWYGTQNISGNYTDIYCKLSLRTSTYGNIIAGNVQKAIAFSIDGTRHDFTNNVTIGPNSNRVLGEWTRRVNHNGDGTKSVNISGYIDMNINYNGWVGTKAFGGNYTLNPIARATQPTAPASVELGKTATINLPRTSTAFTHKVYYEFYGVKKLLSSNAGASYAFTPSLAEYAPYMNNSTENGGIIHVETFNGSTHIGTKTVGMKLVVPASVVPNIGTISITDESTVPTILGVTKTSGLFLQMLSKIRFSVATTQAYSSPIKSYKFELGSELLANSTSNPTDFDLKTRNWGSGAKTIKVTITDGRGRTATKNVAITITAYNAVQINSFTATRRDNGTIVDFTKSGTISSVKVSNVERNTYTTVTEYKEAYSSIWLQAKIEENTFLNLALDGFAVDKSYDVRVVISDKFTSATSTLSVPTAKTLLDLYRDIGVGIGKMYEPGRGVLDVGGHIWMMGKKLIDIFYPVGTIYESTEPTSPAEFMGGKWERWGNGRVLVGLSESESEFNSVAKTGGAKTHTLSTTRANNETGSYRSGEEAAGRGLPNDVNFKDRAMVYNNSGAKPHNNLQPYITVYRWRRLKDDSLPRYTVTFETNGGSAVSSQTVEEGQTFFRPTSPIKNGFTFGGWFSDPELTKVYNFSTVASSNIKLYAKWDKVIVKYTVTFETNGGSVVSSQTVEEGQKFNAPANPVKDGFTFSGWYSDLELTKEYNFDTVASSNIKLYAKWTAIIVRYTLTFNTNGGNTIESQTVVAGQRFTKPTDPNKLGFTFTDWYSDIELTTVYDFDAVASANLTIYAKWEEIKVPQFSLTFNTDGGSAVAKQTVNEGQLFVRPVDPTKDGFIFDNWFIDQTLVTPFDFTKMATEDLTAYAKWTKVIVKYTVTFESNGGNTVSSQTVNEGERFNEPAPPTKTGFTFDGWYSDPELTRVYSFDTVANSNIKLYAKWTAIIVRYTLTFNTNGGNTIESQTVNAGQKLTQPANPSKTGFTFVNWYSDIGLTTVYDFNTVASSNLTIYAKWEAVVIESFPVNLAFTPTKIVVSGNLIYMIAGTTLYQYDSTGKQVWTATVSGTAQSLFVYDDNVYVGTSTGRFYKFNSSGTQQFNGNIGQAINDIAEFNGTLYVATPAGIYRTTSTGTGTIYAATSGVRFNLISGNASYLFDVSQYGLDAINTSGKVSWYVDYTTLPVSLEATTDGVLAGFANGNLIKFANASQQQFSKSFSGAISEIVATASNIYIASGSNVLKLDLEGNMIWQKALPSTITDLGLDGSFIYAICGTTLQRLEV